MPAAPHLELTPPQVLVVHGRGPVADALETAATAWLSPQGWGPARETGSDWTGLQIDGARLLMTDGRPAHEVAAATGVVDLAVFDWPALAFALPSAPKPDAVLSAAGAPVSTPGSVLAFAVNGAASPAWQTQAGAWLHALGFFAQACQDSPGLLVARTIAMLVNEAADAVQQGVCSPEGADAAMKLGVNYPAGPFEWLQALGRDRVAAVIAALDAEYRGERYRLSPWLRRGVSQQPVVAA